MNSTLFAFAAIRPSCAMLMAAATALAFATIALAHEEATGVVKERMDLMDRQKADMKLIGDMAKDLMPFDAAKLPCQETRQTTLSRDPICTQHPHTGSTLPECWPD
jgi:cytochrome c556